MVCNIIDIAVYQAIMIAAYYLAYQPFIHAWLIGCFHWSGERISLPVSTPDHPFSISTPCGWIYRKSFKRLGAEPPTNCPQSPRMWDSLYKPGRAELILPDPSQSNPWKCQMLNPPFKTGGSSGSPQSYKAYSAANGIESRSTGLEPERLPMPPTGSFLT